MFDHRLTGSRRAGARAADLRDAIAADGADDNGIAPRAAGAALVVIDVQNDFTLPGAPAEIAGTMAVVPNIARLLAAFRAAGRPIVHVVRLYAPDGSDAEPVRRPQLRAGGHIVAPGSDGAEIVTALKPAPELRLDPARLLAGEAQPLTANGAFAANGSFAGNEHVIYKPRWGAFYRTALELHLRHRLQFPQLPTHHAVRGERA